MRPIVVNIRFREFWRSELGGEVVEQIPSFDLVILLPSWIRIVRILSLCVPCSQRLFPLLKLVVTEITADIKGRNV
jgi:hypothetical protein